ncbi:MAG: hypothetical protein IJ250_08180 [Bacteroidales bacterium]|nr:hypothetical protein [Bacteroidales bacterium]
MLPVLHYAMQQRMGEKHICIPFEMKKQILFSLLFFIGVSTVVFGQRVEDRSNTPDSVYYYYKDEKIYLPLNKQHFTVCFDLTKNDIKTIERKYNITPIFKDGDTVRGFYDIEILNNNYDSVYKQLISSEDFAYADQVIDEDNQHVLISGRLSIQLKQLEDTVLLKQYPYLKIIRVYSEKFLYRWVDLKVLKNPYCSNLQAGNLLQEQGVAQAVSYGFIPLASANGKPCKTTFQCSEEKTDKSTVQDILLRTGDIEEYMHK